MKEYGGYFSIEIKNGNEYYQYDSTCLQRYNSARSAIIDAVRDGKYQKLWLPIYTCDSIKRALAKFQINYAEYHIDEYFRPVDVSILPNELLLWTNYYGVFEEKWIQDNILKNYHDVLIDNTQAFFCKPQMNVYNVYSCKKFFGVSDGAYLIHQNLTCKPTKRFRSLPSALFLLKQVESGTNGAYEDYLLHEQRIENELLEGMSLLSQRILESIDYDETARKRQANYKYIEKHLNKYNELHFTINTQVPMIYPLLIKSKTLRTYLVQHKIYVSQWWKWVAEYPASNDFERYISEYLLPIPIDQRYAEQDMNEVIDIVECGIQGKV